MCAASEYVSGSVFGTNYRFPLVGLSCGNGASHISECQFYNQTSNCNHKRTIGVICKGNLIPSPQQGSLIINLTICLKELWMLSTDYYCIANMLVM